MNGKLVAILLDESGKCEKVLEVKNLTPKEYNSLKNQETENKVLAAQKEKELNDKISTQKDYIDNLTKNLFHLAKSIFDNFVDRGKCETTDDFENAYFNYVFSGKEIDPALYPNEFAIIYKEITQ